MTEKEVAEIRRRFRPDKGNLGTVHGCYVNEQKEIITEFEQTLGLMEESEAEFLLKILRKTLTGTIEKNLIDISFTTQQVLDSPEHRLLMRLRDSALTDEEARHTFYKQITGSLQIEGNYLILLACETYDLPSYAKDGEKLDDASEVFSYFLCSICPVKPTKPALGYFATENAFRSITADWVVSAPETGFLFPAFDDRTANIYGALYYSRNSAENHPELIDSIFHTDIPMPADEQKETFETILESTIAQDCSLEVVQAVHQQFTAAIAEHKENKEEPLAVSKASIRQTLQTCEVPDSRIEAFCEQYDSAFGADTDLPPQNLTDPKKLEIEMPDVVIHVNPERNDLIETRVLNGIPYLLIRAQDGVKVNGVSISVAPAPDPVQEA